ncbi:hypothetical protein ACT453_21750, partial [Bacillus sp. D-CC]
MGQLLSLENVTLAVEKENSKQAIVKHVSFSISEGEIVALVGESGSGIVNDKFTIIMPVKFGIKCPYIIFI